MSAPMSTSVSRPYPIDGSTRLFGILGHPVTQVKTPQLMNGLFAAGGINAVCLPFAAPPSAFESIVAGLQSLDNLDGLVITVPHKIHAMNLVDEVSDMGQRVGAINVMRRTPDGRWTGDMFDGTGLILGLNRLGFTLRGQRVKQLGAGGAGAAVALALAEAGAAEISIHDPVQTSCQALVERVNRFYPAHPARVDTHPTALDEVDLLINCSPIGMKPDDDMPLPFGPFSPSLQVVDIIMTPEQTPLLAHAKAHGCRATNGRPMIEGQLAAFADFFGIAMPAGFSCFSTPTA